MIVVRKTLGLIMLLAVTAVLSMIYFVKGGK